MVTRAAPRRHRNRPASETDFNGDGPLAATSGLPLFPSPAGDADADGPAEGGPMTGPPAGSQDRGAAGTVGASAVREGTAATTFAAGIASRLVAGIIDVALILALDVLVVGLTLRLAGFTFESFGVLPVAPLAAFLILLDGGYLVVLTAIGGQTFGKMVAGIRVVDIDGHSVRVTAALARATTMVLSLVPAGAGLVWMCAVKDRRGLHDRVAGTRVVVVQRST